MLLSKVPAYFKSRRDALLKQYPHSTFIFPSNAEILRNPDVTYPFRQESNFFYLSGFEEPESCLVIGGGKMTLFVRKRDLEKEMWEGERYGVEGAKQVFGADQAFLIEELDEKLPQLLKGSDQIFYRLGLDEGTDREVLKCMETHRRSLGRSGKSLPPLSDPAEVLGEMRIIKSKDEIEIMSKVCKLTALAHKTAMQKTRPGMNEFEIDALVDYEFRRHGSQRVGYGSIVAGGVNGACLHYRFNNQPLRDGELLLIDAGAELDYYTADITRTFPVGKKFTEAQGKAYDLVLKSQKEAIAMTKPGVTLPAIHKHVCQVLIEGLLSLGLLKGSADEIYKTLAYKRFYPHNTSHWLGMDVHDVGLYTAKGEPRPLEAGMVFTIEPGFYVQPGDHEAPAEYKNIGIRIEDDILVTPTGCEVLTRDVPKDREEIEALRA
jgi:Xaa-Pro aminopeptidase